MQVLCVNRNCMPVVHDFYWLSACFYRPGQQSTIEILSSMYICWLETVIFRLGTKWCAVFVCFLFEVFKIQDWSSLNKDNILATMIDSYFSPWSLYVFYVLFALILKVGSYSLTLDIANQAFRQFLGRSSNVILLTFIVFTWKK